VEGKENGKWKKIISNDIINYLTPHALAFWIMEDGAATASGLYHICTHLCFTN
jgi:hypothetical protein